MRLTALFLMALCVTLATNAGMTDVSGVWVADLAKSKFETSPHPNRVILSVIRDEDRLKVVEVASGEIGAYIAERQYFFKGSPKGVGRDAGKAKTDGRETILRCSDQLERWSISEDGSELIVNRWIGDTHKAPQRVLTFRRAGRTVE